MAVEKLLNLVVYAFILKLHPALQPPHEALDPKTTISKFLR